MDDARLARLTELGLYDPDSPGADDRRAVLEMLVAEDIDDDEMVAAHAEGRLFALAGDRIVRHGQAATYTADNAAATLGVEPADFRRIWRALGLPHVEGLPDLTPAEVDGLAALRDVSGLIGIDASVNVARVIGAAMARVVEAESSAVTTGMAELNVELSQSEAATSVAWRAAAELVPKVGLLLDVVHRRHLRVVRSYFESLQRDESDAPLLGVGFVDLSGFTALSAANPLTTLSKLLSVFEERATDAVLSGGGRVVKFLGDAVMYVATDRASTARIALDLVDDEVARKGGIPVRGGIGWGPTLVQDGDYFGSSVNLAARLVAIAEPGTVLGSPDLADLDGYTTEVLAPQVIRGFTDPIAPVLVRR